MSADPDSPLGHPGSFTESKLPNGAPGLGKVRDLSSAQLWAHRLAVLLFVFFCAVLGVVLVVFPWRDEWTNNSLLVGYPGLQDFVGNGFVRGLCSGLGLLDIWIGFWEAVHYHE